MKPSPDLIDYNFLTWLGTLTKVNFFTQVEHIIRPNSTDFNVQVTYLISNLVHTKKYTSKLRHCVSEHLSWQKVWSTQWNAWLSNLFSKYMILNYNLRVCNYHVSVISYETLVLNNNWHEIHGYINSYGFTCCPCELQ